MTDFFPLMACQLVRAALIGIIQKKRGQDLQEQATMIPGCAVLIFLVPHVIRDLLRRQNEFERGAEA
jgi:hypothetical protein